MVIRDGKILSESSTHEEQEQTEETEQNVRSEGEIEVKKTRPDCAVEDVLAAALGRCVYSKTVEQSRKDKSSFRSKFRSLGIAVEPLDSAS